MSLMVASTRWNDDDEPSCSCSCRVPWLDWLCSCGAKLSVASESRVREIQTFIFLLQVICFGTAFGEGAVKSREAQIIRPETAPRQADAVHAGDFKITRLCTGREKGSLDLRYFVSRKNVFAGPRDARLQVKNPSVQAVPFCSPFALASHATSDHSGISWLGLLDFDLVVHACPLPCR